MNHSGFGILIPFSISVSLSRIVCLLFTIVFYSRLLISIALHCASTIAYTFVDYYTSTCIFVNTCYSTLVTFSSLASICAICASTKQCSIASSSRNSSMYTKSTDVIPSIFYFLCMLMSFAFAQKLNCKCSSCIYIMNYCLCK
jgi:hypothetical protein